MDVRRKNDAIKNRPTYGNPLETIRCSEKKKSYDRGEKNLSFEVLYQKLYN